MRRAQGPPSRLRLLPLGLLVPPLGECEELRGRRLSRACILPGFSRESTSKSSLLPTWDRKAPLGPLPMRLGGAPRRPFPHVSSWSCFRQPCTGCSRRGSARCILQELWRDSASKRLLLPRWGRLNPGGPVPVLLGGLAARPRGSTSA